MCKIISVICIVIAFSSISVEVFATGAGIVYYFNPDGGQYIHSDAHCKTINSKYWPIMEPFPMNKVYEPEYNGMRLCSACCAEKNNAEAFFQGKREREGSFDVIKMAEENLEFYKFCYENSLECLLVRIGERDEQYKILVEGGQGRWGYPDDNDISREMAISIAYAALQKYIGIRVDDLPLYFADPWLDVQSYDYHEWMVRINRAVSTRRFYNSTGYYFYINADNGLISKITRY